MRLCLITSRRHSLTFNAIHPDPLLPRLCVEGHEADVRTDLPAYRVWKDGVIVEETSDVSSVYDERNEEDEFLAFALGCSFSWEDELAEAGLVLAVPDALAASAAVVVLPMSYL